VGQQHERATAAAVFGDDTPAATLATCRSEIAKIIRASSVAFAATGFFALARRRR
jgi:hypothetical protein